MPQFPGQERLDKSLLKCTLENLSSISGKHTLIISKLHFYLRHLFKVVSAEEIGIELMTCILWKAKNIK